MKRAHSFINGILCILLLSAATAPCWGRGAKGVFVEAESFARKGGWTVDPQFCGTMGSPYLLAHGQGRPVADAATRVSLPGKGRYHVYVRTYNWTAPWSAKEGPGAFRVVVDGRETGPVCGTEGEAWTWQYAGSFRTETGSVEVALRDLSGFDGRCDALYFSRRRVRDIVRPEAPEPSEEAEYEFVVVGGGVAGMCAAVSAARLGVKTALVHDRPVLGGNNSSEVRVHLGGEIGLDPYPNLGNTVREWGHTEKGNAGPAERYQDGKKEAFVAAEKNLTLYRCYRAEGVETAGGRILSVTARHTGTGEAIRLRAPLFADCTGDGTVGFLAGADYAYGREGKADYGEPSAPETADRQVLGASVQWNSRVTDAPSPFPEFDYGLSFSDASVARVTHGEWTWETGMFKDMITEAEQVRDYALLVIYSNWSYLKNRAPFRAEYACRELDWVGSVAGKRESRRLLGDVVLTEQDVLSCREFPDAAVTGSWSIDLHYPDPKNTAFFPGGEFLSICEQTAVDYYCIPYRCLYSRNVENLFMAGRNISVTHIALGTTRVMRTTAMEGEVVGMAASLASRFGTTPRGVYRDRLSELKELMTRGTGKTGLPNNQRFNKGHKPRSR